MNPISRGLVTLTVYWSWSGGRVWEVVLKTPFRFDRESPVEHAGECIPRPALVGLRGASIVFIDQDMVAPGIWFW